MAARRGATFPRDRRRICDGPSGMESWFRIRAAQTANAKSANAMIRFVFRFAGFLILAAAFAALLYDGTKTIASSDVYFTPLRITWNAVNSTSLQSLQPMIERHVAWLWDPVMLNILAAPTWLVLGVLGSLLILIGRRKRPLIGYSR